MRSHRSNHGLTQSNSGYCLPWPLCVHLGTEYTLHRDRGCDFQPTWLGTAHALASFPMFPGGHLISSLFLLWAACTSVKGRYIWNQLQLPVTGTLHNTSLWESHVRLTSGTSLCSLLSTFNRHCQEQNTFVQPGKLAFAVPPHVSSDLGEERLPRAAWEHRI